MKTYMGFNQNEEGVGDGLVLVVNDYGSRPLNPRNDVRNHSPDGLSWGYWGSGPAQLALAILCDALENVGRAVAIYQEFKVRVVAGWPMNEPWSITHDAILRHVRQIEIDRAREQLLALGPDLRPVDKD